MQGKRAKGGVQGASLDNPWGQPSGCTILQAKAEAADREAGPGRAERVAQRTFRLVNLPVVGFTNSGIRPCVCGEENRGGLKQARAQATPPLAPLSSNPCREVQGPAQPSLESWPAAELAHSPTHGPTPSGTHLPGVAVVEELHCGLRQLIIRGVPRLLTQLVELQLVGAKLGQRGCLEVPVGVLHFLRRRQSAVGGEGGGQGARSEAAGSSTERQRWAAPCEYTLRSASRHGSACLESSQPQKTTSPRTRDWRLMVLNGMPVVVL